MKRSFFYKPIQAFAVVVLILLSGCAKNQTDRSLIDRAVQKMNHRDYADAARILEDVYSRNPGDSSAALLLAQAYLGKADFEMLGLVGKVSGVQNPAANDKYWLEKPSCDDQPIKKLAGYDFRCVLFRLMNHLPDVENPDFIKARQLLRTAFPDPSTTPNDVNFLASLVEFTSAFYRLRTFAETNSKTLMNQEPTDVDTANAQFKLFSYNFKRFLKESSNGFIRLRYSYGKLAGFVKGLDGKPMVKIGENSLNFSDTLQTSDLLKFGGAVLQDRFESIDGQISDEARREIQFVGLKYNHLLRRFDRVYFNPENLAATTVYWRFSHAVSSILELLCGKVPDGAELKPAMLLWEHPPIIFDQLRNAVTTSWSDETVVPVWNYFLATKDQWNELGSILDGWGTWFDRDLSELQRTQIKTFIHDSLNNDPRFRDLPVRIRSESMEKYGNELTRAVYDRFGEVLSGKAKAVEPLSSEQIASGQLLMLRTAVWINSNLWTFSR